MMNKEPVIDRALYKRIKNMPRQELDNLLKHMYEIGVKEASTELFSKTQEIIKTIPGIGEKRYNQIIEALDPIFNNIVIEHEK